ncbi:MAG: META domain-containing protein [Burkholderiales bacterium]|jgi:heat shock protein HslJ|nr:META domain-containing protein [Burkholderiales bacterium]
MKKILFSCIFVVVSVLAACNHDTADVVEVSERPISAPAAAESVAPQPESSPQPLQNVPWSWQYTINAQNERIAPDRPERYTLLLRPDGGVAVLADCNRGGTAFQENEGKLAFEMIAMTKMSCSPKSKADVFLSGLHDVESYHIDGTTLTFTLRDRSMMIFVPLAVP